MSVNVGTGVKRARGKGGATLRIRNAWDPVSEDRLLQWIEVRLNYECWKCSSSTDSSGKKNTSGKRKIDVSRNSKIPSKLRNYAMGTRANPKQSAGLENSWRNAQDYLSKTGEALSDEEKRANLSINGMFYLRSNLNLIVDNLLAVHLLNNINLVIWAAEPRGGRVDCMTYSFARLNCVYSH